MGRAHEKWHICKCLIFHAKNLLKVYTQKNSGYTKSRRKIRQQKIPKIDSKFLHIELLSREAWASKDTRFLTLSLRRVQVLFLLILQLCFLFFIFQNESFIAQVLRSVVHIISGFLVLYIISKKDKGANKVIWIFLILLFPLFGSLLYILYNFQASTRKFEQKIFQIGQKNRTLYGLPGSAEKSAYYEAPAHIPQIRYLKYAGFPVYDDTQTEYLSPGEKFFPIFLEELKKAQKYIFIEYFIIKEGLMWQSILDILKEKVSQGVEVRVIYDDIGCFLALPKDYAMQLKNIGIKCEVFNPFRPVLTAIQNNRDHRKVTIIDGKAFSQKIK